MKSNNGTVVKQESSSASSSTGTVYPIVLSNTTKKWNIAKFTSKVDIPNFAKPVKMYRYKPDLSENTENTDNPAAVQKKKKYEPKPMNPKLYPWRLEDSEGNNAFQGMIEGNQASCYFIFMFQSDGSIKAVPCTDWYTFRMRKDIDVLSIEEAEAFMNRKSKERDEWTTPRVKKTSEQSGSGEKKPDDEDDKEDSEFRKEIYEDKDKFKATFGNKKKRRGDEEDEGGMGEGEDEDAPDFENKFDDDDEAFEDNDITTEDGPQIEAEEDDNEHLTATGIEMKNIIKNMGKHESSEDEEDDKSDSGDDDDEEEPDDDDFTITKENLNFRYPKNDIHVKEEPKSGKTTTTTTTTTTSSSSTPPNGKKKAAAATKSKIGSPEQTISAATAKKGVKNKADASNVGTTANNTANKKVKTEQTSPPTSPPASATAEEYPLTEESIKKVLRTEKKVTSIELIQLFKNQLKSKEQKDLFMKYTNKLANIVKEDDVKYLVLKPEFK